MTDQKHKRNSSIELLKIVALFFVVLCHSIPLYKYGGATELDGYINLGQSTSSLQTLVLIVFSHLGQVGNALFIVPSAFFLLDSDRVKKEKIVQFIIDTFCVSVIYLIIFIVIKGNLPLSYITSSVLPITFNFYWFITCYIILYAIHPWLNQIIRKLEKTQLFSACLCMFVLYCLISYVLNGKYYYSHLVGFIVYYFFMGYVKLYLPALSANKKQNIKILLSCICGFIGLIVVANYLGLRVSAANGLVGILERFVNPFIVGMTISAFNLCKLKQSSNRLINRVSSTSLLVFVISNNVIVCSYAKPVLFESIYKNFSYSYIAPICLAIAAITLMASVLLAMVYMNTIQKVVIKVCGWVVLMFSSLASQVYCFIDNIEQKRGGVLNNQYIYCPYSIYMI